MTTPLPAMSTEVVPCLINFGGENSFAYCAPAGGVPSNALVTATIAAIPKMRFIELFYLAVV